MRTIARGLMFVAMAVGLAVLAVAVSRRERDRTRAFDSRPGDLDDPTAVSNGHGNGHQQEAYEEI
jgi:hypothetical protein